MRRLVTSPRASMRLVEAERWLDRPATRRLVVAANAAAAAEITRRAASLHGGSFGWDHKNLQQLAIAVAEPVLAGRQVAPASRVALDALAARVVARLARNGGLGRFAPVADRLGFAQALSRTMQEVRLAGVGPDRLPPDLAVLAVAFDEELTATRLADPAAVVDLATKHLRAGGAWAWDGVATLWCDLVVRNPLETDLLRAVAERVPDVLALAPSADARTVEALRSALGVEPEALPLAAATGLARLQIGLFDDRVVSPGPPGDDVVLMSAPGEERECAEIARRILRAASEGVAFDRVAVLLRAPVQYRLELEEVFGRAGIPAWWSQGTRMPDPAGRAFLALLACRAEGYSARRFAEYLSLGEVPSAQTTTDGDDDADAKRIVPRRWEELLVDAAVIGGLDRWRRRLDGLEATLRNAIAAQADDAPGRERDIGRLAQLVALREHALPLLERLADLPDAAPWQTWLAQLEALALASLREPDRVIEVLRDLHLMGPVGPVGLAEVRHVLGPHLLELASAPLARRYGKVFVGSLDAARGLDFDVVIVPGLAERILPAKVAEDPLLLDVARHGLPLDTNEERVDAERLLLRLAVGAATRQVILSWPRLELDQVRPRVPSYYALEVVRAVEGVVPAFRELAARADQTGASRIGWPAPRIPEDAIDDAEYDLAVLGELLHRPASETRGAARWLLGANPHLARSLRGRWSRWDSGAHRWDGLFAPTSAPVRDALVAHHPTRTGWSATTLELYAQCPYRMYLYGIQRLAPREEPVQIDRLDPMSRGSIVHELLFRLLVELREAGGLPLTAMLLDDVRPRVERLVDEVAARWHDDLHPAIERVWQDEIALVRADLLEWIAVSAEDPDWVPWRFELAFGLPGFARSDADRRPEPVTLPNGLQLRGAIDLVERRGDGVLRVTDFKTGKVRAEGDDVVRGGRVLQPLLYALASEVLFPGSTVMGGRLWHVTREAGFEDVTFGLDAPARGRVDAVVGAIGEDVAGATLVAAPEAGACRWCAYRPVCGGSEEHRVKRKDRAVLARLDRVRGLP